LATRNPSGAVDIVPITFAFVDDATVITAVDHKPKRTTKLQRLDNIRADARVTLLIDHYEEDWSRLWWARLRGRADVVDEPASEHLAPLIQKYAQYQKDVPAGPLIVVHIEHVRGWSAQGDYGTE